VQYNVAVEKLKRAEQLLKDKAGSLRVKQEAEAEVANVTAALRVAQARVELLKGNVSQGAADKLSTLTIESPISGVIQKVYSAPSQVVGPASPVFDIASLSPVWVRVAVYAGDLQSIEKKKPATVRSLSDFSGSENFAVASPVDGPTTADPLTSSADVFYSLANKEEIFRPGQKVSATIPLKQNQSVSVVPYSAILYDIHGGTWVYENPQPLVFIRRRVELDYVDQNLAVLKRGPASGTKVVTVGAAELFGTEFGGGK
jgi:RND family efflux transporter MFP subunit